jgi:polyisoprenoid-binding protein YceI
MTTTAATTSWTADTVHSTANFAVRHMVVATFRGAFTDVTGSLDLSAEAPRLVGEVDVTSIQVKDENLYGHLQGPDFFDADVTPTITFASASVVRDGDDVTIAGDLTIKGTTQRVTATGTWLEIEADVTGNPRIGIDVETTIDRTAFGLNWNAPLPKGGVALENDVTLSVHLELVPAQG